MNKSNTTTERLYKLETQSPSGGRARATEGSRAVTTNYKPLMERIVKSMSKDKLLKLNEKLSENKYARLLQNSSDDLLSECARIAQLGGVPSLQELQSLAASIEQVKIARLSFQVFSDSRNDANQ